MKISYRRLMASTQVKLRTDLQSMFKRMSDRLNLLLLTEAGTDGTVNPREENDLRRKARAMVDSYFVNPDPFGRDGVTDLAEYPRLLNQAYVRIVGTISRTHQNYLQATLPDDLYRWLQGARVPEGAALKESRQGGMRFDLDLRLVQEMTPREALVNYDPMHTWIDPKGYRLSDRIWRVADTTRQQIDDLLAESVRLKRSARDTAKLLERFLNPDAASLRTRTPYGSDGSYAATRLARTEIARAHNQGALLAAQLNPYVEFVDVARSRNGDPKCPICPQHATIDISGNRVRDPYPKDQAPVSTFHPHCRCATLPVVTDNPQAVTDELTQAVQSNTPAPLTPAAPSLLQFTFGYYLYQLWLGEQSNSGNRDFN